MVAVILAALFLPFTVFADDTEEEFLAKKEYYETRFEGYFQEALEKEKWEEQRVKGAPEQKLERQKQAQEYEQARKEYRKERRSSVDPDPREWEAMKKAKDLEREAQRKEYARRRRMLNDIVQKKNYIPEMEELDINTRYFMEE